MVEFMANLFLGNIFVMAITILLIGFMFLLRVMLNVWFDTDFFKSIVAWFKKADEKIERRQQIKREREKIRLAESRETWVVDEIPKKIYPDREFED